MGYIQCIVLVWACSDECELQLFHLRQACIRETFMKEGRFTTIMVETSRL